MAVYRIDEDTHLIDQHVSVDGSVRMVNSLVIQSRRPTIVDTCFRPFIVSSHGPAIRDEIERACGWLEILPNAEPFRFPAAPQSS